MTVYIDERKSDALLSAVKQFMQVLVKYAREKIHRAASVSLLFYCSIISNKQTKERQPCTLKKK